MAQALHFATAQVEDPRRAEIRHLHARGSYAEVADLAFTWIKENPRDWDILRILSDACHLSGYLDEAEKLYAYGFEHEGSVFFLSGLGICASARGDRESAEKILREAIRREPADPRTWMELSAAHRFEKDDPLAAKLRRQLKRNDIDSRTKSILHYAMCKASNDMGKWDQAWHHASEGGRLDDEPFKIESVTEWIDDLYDVFDADFLAERPGRGVQSDAPIFIVGAPRSGTTLAERILAGSGEAAAMGEMPNLPRLCATARKDDYIKGNTQNRHGWVRRWRDDAFTAAGQFILDDVKRRAGGTMPRFFTDKLPGNLINLGQISLLFPKAKIVRMHRNPLDNCVSLYLGRFGSGHNYTRRVDWLATSYLAYQGAADFLAPMVPNPVLDVHYEKLVADPEGEGRRLVEFAGMEWTADVLDPGKTQYASVTRSQYQVRSKINTSAIGRWRRYKNKIGPLAEALGIDISSET